MCAVLLGFSLWHLRMKNAQKSEDWRRFVYYFSDLNSTCFWHLPGLFDTLKEDLTSKAGMVSSKKCKHFHILEKKNKQPGS